MALEKPRNLTPRKRVWVAELPQCFIRAVGQLRLKKAKLKTILKVLPQTRKSIVLNMPMPLPP